MRPAVVVTALLLGLGSALAHPPDDFGLSFADSSKILTIQIRHPVKGDNHYIDKVTIALNGKQVISQTFKSQFDSEDQVVSYVIIDAAPGDKLTVTANCSVFGKLSRNWEIPAAAEDGNEE